MFANQYYCLVASLREYTLDSDTKGFDAREIVGEILEGVKRNDAREVRLLYGYYDCENWRRCAADVRRTTAGEPHARGAGGGAEGSAAASRGGWRGSCVPTPIPKARMPSRVDTAQRFERELFGAYYAVVCAFAEPVPAGVVGVRPGLRNVTAAIAARATGPSDRGFDRGAAVTSRSSCSAVRRPISGCGANSPASTR